MLLCSKPVQKNCFALFKIFFKPLRAVRVKETKVSSRKVYIDIPFTLSSEKESKINKKKFLRDYPEILGLAIDPYTENVTCMLSPALF